MLYSSILEFPVDPSFFLFIFYFPLLLCWVGVHCSIYKGSYDVAYVSYLKSPPPKLCSPSSPPHYWNSFNRCHLCIYIHVYTLFEPIFIPLPLSPPPPPSPGAILSCPAQACPVNLTKGNGRCRTDKRQKTTHA
jgi:hypothetical protein